MQIGSDSTRGSWSHGGLALNSSVSSNGWTVSFLVHQMEKIPPPVLKWLFLTTLTLHLLSWISQSKKVIQMVQVHSKMIQNLQNWILTGLFLLLHPFHSLSVFHSPSHSIPSHSFMSKSPVDSQPPFGLMGRGNVRVRYGLVPWYPGVYPCRSLKAGHPAGTMSTSIRMRMALKTTAITTGTKPQEQQPCDLHGHSNPTWEGKSRTA